MFCSKLVHVNDLTPLYTSNSCMFLKKQHHLASLSAVAEICVTPEPDL